MSTFSIRVLKSVNVKQKTPITLQISERKDGTDIIAGLVTLSKKEVEELIKELKVAYMDRTLAKFN